MEQNSIDKLTESQRALVSSAHIKVATLIVFDPEFCDQLYYYIKDRSGYRREFRAVASLIGASTLSAIVNSIPQYNSPQLSGMTLAGLGFGASSIKDLIDKKKDLDGARQKLFNDIITKEMVVPKKLLVRFFDEYLQEPDYLAQVGDINDPRFMMWFNNGVNAGFREDEILDGLLKDTSVLKAWLRLVKNSQQTLDNLVKKELFSLLGKYQSLKNIPKEILEDALPEYKNHPEYYSFEKINNADEK